jgi:hypothetical protein
MVVSQGVLDETDSRSRVRILEDEVKRYQVSVPFSSDYFRRDISDWLRSAY